MCSKECRRGGTPATDFMPSHLRTIFRFAKLGFGVTAALFSCRLILETWSHAPNPVAMLVFVVLCPPSLLWIFIRDVEMGTRLSYFLWVVIAVANAALYAGVCAVMMYQRKKIG